MPIKKIKTKIYSCKKIFLFLAVVVFAAAAFNYNKKQLSCLLNGQLFIASEGNSEMQTYYIDSSAGNDSNSGISSDAAWKTIAKVNSMSFNPGDSVLFKRGEVWREGLIAPSSGASGNPIAFGAYGTGASPIIRRSYLYDNWWPYSVFYRNAGFELLDSGAVDDEVDDNFTWWYEAQGTGGYIRAVSDSYQGGIALKICRNIATAYVRNTVSIAPNTQYYLDMYAKLGAGSAAGFRVRITDTSIPNNSLDLQDDGTWSSAYNELETFSVSSNDWTKKNLIFTTQPSTVGVRIDFMAMENNTTVYVDDVYLIAGTARVSKKVWMQYFGSNFIPRGILDNGVRIENQTVSPPQDMLDDNKWEKLSSYVYYRKDSGEPHNIEVGTWPRAVDINGKNYITVDSIDAFGPAGTPSNDTSAQLVEIRNGANNIIIKNAELESSNGEGIWAGNTTADITYENLTVHNCRSTGIYMNSQGGNILGCRVYDNGRMPFDWGDRGGIGSYQGSNIIIKGNEVYNNGPDDQDVDAEISVVAPTSPIIISNNYVHHCIQMCIQLASGGSNSIVSNNIINDFASCTAASSSYGHWAGIRIGGGEGCGTGIKVFNNNISDGKYPSDMTGQAGIHVVFDCSGLVLKNNIFSDNLGSDVFIRYGAGTAGDDFDNNIFYKNNYTDNWYWKGLIYSTLYGWQSKTALDSNSTLNNPLFMNSSGNYSQSADFQLSWNSPAIDAGGAESGIVSDYYGNSIYGLLDVGAIEYQPPYNMGIDKPDIGANVRVYGDGKFRNKNNPSGVSADLSIIPAFADVAKWLDVVITIWNTSGDYKKKWTEESPNFGSMQTSHIAGGLKPNTNYDVKVNDIEWQGIAGCDSGACMSDAQGKITFNYIGGYSTSTFEITEGETPVPEVPVVPPNSAPQAVDAAPQAVDTAPENEEESEPEEELNTNSSPSEPGIEQILSPDEPDPSSEISPPENLIQPLQPLLNPEAVITVPETQKDIPAQKVPKIKKEAKASGKIIDGKTLDLSVLASDDKGEENLIYIWQVLNGPADAVFSNNNNNQAKNTSAAFLIAGKYVFQAAIQDEDGNAAISKTEEITVKSIPDKISISSSNFTPIIFSNNPYQFFASVKDQFGNPVNSDEIIWSVSGGGIIDKTGLFAAGSDKRGVFSAEVSLNGSSIKSQAQFIIISPASFNSKVSLIGITLRSFGKKIFGVLELLWNNRR